MNTMEPEALSFQPSGDFGKPSDAFSVPQYAKSGPSDAANASYAAQRSLALQGQAQADIAKAQADSDAQAAKISGMQARARARARASAMPTPGALPTGLSSPFSSGEGAGSSSRLGSLFDDTSGAGRLTFSHGTERVPGHGSGHVDTVPAMLAPGEAVLNRAAAEQFGRGNIAQLNAAGARQMGFGMHGSDEMNDFLRSQGIGVAPQVNMTPTRGIPAPQVGGPDPSLTAWRNIPPPAPPRLQPPGPAANFQPTPVTQPPSPNMRAMGIGVAPEMPFPQIDRGPQVGIPNRRAAMQTAPTWDQDFVDAHGGMTPPATLPDPNSFYPDPSQNRLPVMQPERGMGMRPNPSLGSERARGGLSAFEQAFAAARKGGQDQFYWNGPNAGWKTTKLR